MLSISTGLSEGQVYKWGWDQKRKRFGPEEAERMRQVEMQMNKEIDARRKRESMMSQQQAQANQTTKSDEQQSRFQTPMQPSLVNRVNGSTRQSTDLNKSHHQLETPSSNFCQKKREKKHEQKLVSPEISQFNPQKSDFDT